jgi:hypothetical protein
MSHASPQVVSILIVPSSRKQGSKWSMSHPEVQGDTRKRSSFFTGDEGGRSGEGRENIYKQNHQTWLFVKEEMHVIYLKNNMLHK